MGMGAEDDSSVAAKPLWRRPAVIVPLAIAVVVVFGGVVPGIAVANYMSQQQEATGSGIDSGEDATDPMASPSPTSAVKPSTTPSPVAPTLKLTWFECTYKEPGEAWESPSYATENFEDVHDIWASGTTFEWCEVTLSGRGSYSTTDENALTVAYGNPTDYENLLVLWEICADTTGFYQTNGPINADQQAEANGALLLCPDHPSADIMANGSKEQQERNAGLRFGAGVFEVGSQIQAGTYRASGEIKNCYWERLDSAGEIIDNNFVSAASQVEVTIQPDDFSVHFSGCGEFVKIE